MGERPPRYANLDEDFEPWNIFLGVQPVFLLNLGWHYPPESSDSSKAVQDAIEFEALIPFFKDYMKDLPRRRPRNTLSVSELKHCEHLLTRLLDCLEGFVAAGVVQAAAAGELPRQQWGSNSARAQTMGFPFRIFSEVTTKLHRRLGWFETDATRPLPVAAASGASAEGSSTAQKYHRLRALGELFSRQPDEALRWLISTQPIGQFREAKESLRSVLEEFASLALPDITLDAVAIADSKWKHETSRGVSILLYQRVEQGTSTCEVHQAKIQLPGVLLTGSDELAGRDIFLSPCPGTDHTGTGMWRRSHFTRIEDRPPESPLVAQEPIRDLCIHFSKEDLDSQTWNIDFNKRGLYPSVPSKTPPVADGCSPTMPLSTLLSAGMLRRGEVLSDIHKASLALSLGRYLLHLLHTSWLQEAWTAESINFLYQKTGDFKSTFTDPEVNLQASPVPTGADWRPTLWSFAKLLLDIQTGILTEIEIQDNPETIRKKVWDGIRDLQLDCRVTELRRYIQAVHGCVNFAKSLKTYQQRAGRAMGDSLDAQNDVRRVLYSEVVQYLEMHLEFLLGGPENVTKVDIPLPAMSTSQQISKRAWIEAENCGSENSASLNKAKFSSDSNGESSAKEGFDSFLRRYRQFRRRFIVPNMTKDKRSGRQRIRIALLDTGLGGQGSDLESMITEVMKYRKSQGFTEHSEAKATSKDNPRYPIKKRKSFIERDESCLDTSRVGHGTQLACLLLKLAPDADLYIAKVSMDMEFEVTEGVVEAIKWAVGPEVKADIITMSFGVSGVSHLLDGALKFVMEHIGISGHTPLVFASASNGGLAMPGRSHPASDIGRVICAYALDGRGNDTSCHNPRVEPHAPNFGTLGHGVKVKWGKEESYASGTSYAAPVLAAITANYLDWLSHVEDRLGPRREYLWRKEYIERAFEKFMSYKRSDSDDMMFVHPENVNGFKFGKYDVKENEVVDPAVTEADAEASANVLGLLNGWLSSIA